LSFACHSPRRLRGQRLAFPRRASYLEGPLPSELGTCATNSTCHRARTRFHAPNALLAGNEIAVTAAIGPPPLANPGQRIAAGESRYCFIPVCSLMGKIYHAMFKWRAHPRSEDSGILPAEASWCRIGGYQFLDGFGVSIAVIARGWMICAMDVLIREICGRREPMLASLAACGHVSRHGDSCGSRARRDAARRQCSRPSQRTLAGNF